MKICIDAGHGQHDPGAVGASGLKEKDVVLKIALKVGKKLENNGLDVIYTRTNDNPGFPVNQSLNLQKRCDIANKNNADIFISIHCNSAGNTQANGVETFILKKGIDAEKLARNVQNKIVKATGLANRGVKTANFYVLRHTKMPAILVETAFISNTAEERLLRENDFQDRVAAGIVKGICEYIGVDYKGDPSMKSTKIYFKNKAMNGFIDSGRTYVELRKLCELLGLKVHFDSKTKTTEVIKNG